jgi:hypothetical protein
MILAVVDQFEKTDPLAVSASKRFARESRAFRQTSSRSEEPANKMCTTDPAVMIRRDGESKATMDLAAPAASIGPRHAIASQSRPAHV